MFESSPIRVTQNSIFEEVNLNGTFAYIDLKGTGILELHSTMISDKISFENLIPFLEVFNQFSQGLKSGYDYQKLEEEISNRKEAERSLRVNEAKYKNIINNIKLGLLEVDNDDRILFANEAFCTITGYDQSELIGRNATGLLVGTDEKDSSVILDP